MRLGLLIATAGMLATLALLAIEPLTLADTPLRTKVVRHWQQVKKQDATAVLPLSSFRVLRCTRTVCIVRWTRGKAKGTDACRLRRGLVVCTTARYQLA